MPSDHQLATPARRPRVDVVVPVYNEERALGRCVRRLHEHLTTDMPYEWRIVVANNASTDDTARVARALVAELPGVELIDPAGAVAAGAFAVTGLGVAPGEIHRLITGWNLAPAGTFDPPVAVRFPMVGAPGALQARAAS